jgi:hypothetical protein
MMNIRGICAGLFVLGLVSGGCSSGEASTEQLGTARQALCTSDGECGLYACVNGNCESNCHLDTDCVTGATCVDRVCTIGGDPNPCGPSLVVAYPITSCVDNFDCVLGDRCYPYAGYICCHDPYNDR